MSMQSVKGGVPFPAYPTTHLTLPQVSNTGAIDAAGEKLASIYVATAAKAIRTIWIRTGTVTTGDTVDVRVETVDSAANGDPTGTLWAANTNGALVIASTDDNTWKSVTLTADATVAVGDVFAIVVVNGAGGGSILLNAPADQGAGLPYGDHFTAAWAKTTTVPLLLPQYADGSVEPIFGITDYGAPVNTDTFNSGDATNRRGNIFQVAFPTRAKGCWAWVDADGDFTVKLYDSDGSTVLATTAAVNRFQRSSANGDLLFLPFLTTASLSANINYRVAIVPSSVTNLSTYSFDVPTAALLDMFPGGQAMHASVFTSGAWVETTTRRTYLGLFLDGFDDGVSAGGGRRPRLVTMS